MSNGTLATTEYQMTDFSIAIIGLGYVGLPLAIEFGKKFDTCGFDINQDRINELSNAHDNTLEVVKESFSLAKNLKFTCDIEDIENADIYIITVPTPINKNNMPDLNPLKSACEKIGPLIRSGNIVIFESTVFPGCTEEFCVPILEKKSALKYGEDFFCGYSPERINPGDKQRTLTDIVKVISASNEKTLETIKRLYGSIISAGTHSAQSIKIAEAAKVIENTQRDVNIALINELSLIFKRLDIDTNAVLAAARTKWNFLDFKPGLVGGHCIGIDPYYLSYKAREVGYIPEIIEAGRRINDGMPAHVAEQLILSLCKKGINPQGSKVLISGVTFKENCPDIRNSKIFKTIEIIEEYGCHVHLHDTVVNPVLFFNDTGRLLNSTISCEEHFDALLLAVPHETTMYQLSNPEININAQFKIIFDLKGVLNDVSIDFQL